MSFSFLSPVDRDTSIDIISGMKTQARQLAMMKKPGDLGARTVDYGLAVMELCGTFPQGFAARHIAGQLVRSATSVAANYAEATDAESREDFIHKMKLAMKELAEARCWLRIIGESGYLPPERLAPLIEESREISRMMGASVATARSRMGENME